MDWNKAGIQGCYYEVTWTDSQDDLTRNGGQRELFITLGEARKAYKSKTKTYPYVMLDKVIVDTDCDPQDAELIEYKNVYNW